MFDDDDELAFDGNPYYQDITKICGKGQKFMVYKCVLNPNHDGKCYCGCKKIEFDPD